MGRTSAPALEGHEATALVAPPLERRDQARREGDELVPVGARPDKRTSQLERMQARDHANGNGATPKPRIGGRGAAGTQFFAGYIQTPEYVPELTWPRSIVTYEKMRRSDGMVRATLRALTMPLLSALWDIEPGTEDESDIAIRDWVYDGLFTGMTMTWKRTLREAMTSIPFGHAILNPWFEVRDNDEGKHLVMPRKLLPIGQRTISRFNVEDDGGLKSVHQQQYRDGVYKEEEIPIRELLVFVNEQEGADWLGQSVLRPAYKHWWIADQLSRIQAIAAERHGVGIPYAELPEGADDPETVAMWEEILANIRVNERGYVVVTGGAKFGIAGMGEGRGMDVLPMIQHHNRMTAMSVLAQFLTLGSTDTGSWALSSDQSGLFLMALQTIGDEIASVFNDYLIKPWVDYNVSGVKRYPRLTCTNIETRNGDKVLTAVADAIAKGAITYDRELEDALRDFLNLPAMPEEQEELEPIGDPLAPAPPPIIPPAGDVGDPGAPQDPGTTITPTPATRYEIRQGKRVKVMRLTPAQRSAVDAETAAIRTRSSEYEGRPHAYAPAKWTHPNGHPRCRLCGREEPISGRCDGQTFWQVRAARNHSWPPRRAMRPNEAKASMQELDDAIDRGRSRIALAGAPGTDLLIRELAEKAARAVTIGNVEGLEAKPDQAQVDAIAASVKAELEQLYAFGAGTVREEIIRQLEDLRRLEASDREQQLVVIENARTALADAEARIDAARAESSPVAELMTELITELRARDQATLEEIRTTIAQRRGRTERTKRFIYGPDPETGERIVTGAHEIEEET